MAEKKDRKYAVVKIGGAQKMVREGDLLEVPCVEGKEGSKFKVKDVLLTVSSKGPRVGTPLVAGAEVTFKIEEHGKGRKVEIRKFKSKSRYRRKTGHRQPISKLRVEAIKISKASNANKVNKVSNRKEK